MIDTLILIRHNVTDTSYVFYNIYHITLGLNYFIHQTFIEYLIDYLIWSWALYFKVGNNYSSSYHSSFCFYKKIGEVYGWSRYQKWENHLTGSTAKIIWPTFQEE